MKDMKHFDVEAFWNGKKKNQLEPFVIFSNTWCIIFPGCWVEAPWRNFLKHIAAGPNTRFKTSLWITVRRDFHFTTHITIGSDAPLSVLDIDYRCDDEKKIYF